MARKETTNKGFKIIVLSPKEAESIGFGVPVEGCICASCNGTISEEIYYIAAFNDVMCKKCYEDWHKSARYYQEDADVEQRNYEYVEHLLDEASKGRTRKPHYPRIISFD